MQDILHTDYLQDILVESHGVNQDAISFDEYTIGYEKKNIWEKM